MVRVIFTPNLRRHCSCDAADVTASTVLEAILRAVEHQAGLKGYVLDEHDRLRKHMTVFVNGQPVKDRVLLSDAVEPNTEVYVMQALSGG
ncbi:MAG: MoaD/ThiS family protein [Planctomyces sp.]|nr:MoaD/ThiS family protein [Planctomyces sp.]